MQFETVIGLEIHAELETRSKMFCSCRVVDPTQTEPNVAVCQVCSGMPGVLPVINQKAVEYALRVALALNCEIATTSIFARKNYFYPDLPKGYQISQYEQPLARYGRLLIRTSEGQREIRVRRVHIEEDTGKLIHIKRNGDHYSLVDLNRAGVPLLEIVSEPDLRSPEEARAYATALRTLLRYLKVNSGDMQKGVMRVEPNISLRPVGSSTFGTRTEIKNLNSFRALERALEYEIQRQVDLLRRGEPVIQQTVGWDEVQEVTYPQRTKEQEDDYRYFPEPDLPPLVLSEDWIADVRASLPELPDAKFQRFQEQYGLTEYEADLLVTDGAVADYFEAVLAAVTEVTPKVASNWVIGELFGLMNQAGVGIEALKVTPSTLGGLIHMVVRGEINNNTAKTVLAEMFETGQDAESIVEARGLRQISDSAQIAVLVEDVLEENPEQVAQYLAGKEALSQWFFGQVMRVTRGKADPQVVQRVLERQLIALKER
ncbi:MAG: Asp-tRNA(Asn)/Glu-tRNA(Gln) amidotransferase subunit GatB [Anaerolineales bacterium]|jgi:aspartyl-tRNA(Asn)/glutamyl-tRNA(Gln) amidotransferase subunit B